MQEQPMTVRKTGAKSLSTLNCSAALGAEGRRFESFRPDHLFSNGDKHLAACSLIPHNQAVFLTDRRVSNGNSCFWCGSPIHPFDTDHHLWCGGRPRFSHEYRPDRPGSVVPIHAGFAHFQRSNKPAFRASASERSRARHSNESR